LWIIRRRFHFIKQEAVTLQQGFFEQLCVDYYEKILRYLYGVLADEAAANDCTQDVFLIACQKADALSTHPNPGGFLFKTAKNLARKSCREGFKQMLNELRTEAAADALISKLADLSADIEKALDEEINENDYIETVLGELSEDKRKLYTLYYINKQTMAEIALRLGAEEPAVRMRYVRLRREIKAIIIKISEQNFLL
jgi:RNA polymerase sigma-70 factor (ECF subfamily)